MYTITGFESGMMFSWAIQLINTFAIVLIFYVIYLFIKALKLFIRALKKYLKDE